VPYAKIASVNTQMQSFHNSLSILTWRLAFRNVAAEYLTPLLNGKHPEVPSLYITIQGASSNETSSLIALLS
jgi:hypothetical protein